MAKNTSDIERPAQAGLQTTIHALWWLIMLQGVVAVFFGIVAIFWPALTLVTLVYLFSGFVLAWGIVEIAHALLSIKHRDTWWLTLIFGVVGLGAGVYLVRHPNVSFAAFIVIVGLTLISRGILDIVAVFLDRRSTTHKALLLILGALAIVAGVFVLLQPASGGVAFVWALGLYALIFGTLSIAMAIEARGALASDGEE